MENLKLTLRYRTRHLNDLNIRPSPMVVQQGEDAKV